MQLYEQEQEESADPSCLCWTRHVGSGVDLVDVCQRHSVLLSPHLLSGRTWAGTGTADSNHMYAMFVGNAA